MDTPEVGWLAATILAVGGSGGLLGWLNDRAKLKAELASAKAGAPAQEQIAQAEIAKAQAAFQETLSVQASAFVQTLLEERDRRERVILELRRRIDVLEAENEQCRGENRQVNQRLDSLVTLLRKRGIEIPGKEMPGSFMVLEGDTTTVLAPQPPHETPREPDNG